MTSRRTPRVCVLSFFTSAALIVGPGAPVGAATTAAAVTTTVSSPTNMTATVSGVTTTPEPGSLPAVWSAVGSPYVIDPQAAQQLFDSYWQLRLTDLSFDDDQLLGLIETGPALRVDANTCGCGVAFWGPSLADSIFLTKQTSFPAYFVAESRTDIGGNSSAARSIVVLLFERTSASSSWKVVVDSQQQDLANKPPAQTIDTPLTDSAGYDIADVLIFPGGANALTADAAAYWEYWAVHRAAPPSSVFTADYWTTEWSPTIATEEQTVSDEGYPVRFHFSVAESNNAWLVPQWQRSIAFGSVMYTATFTNPGGVVNQDAEREPFAPSLAPGRYTSVVETKVVEPWFYILPDGKASIYGASPWPVAITGYGWRPLS